MGKEITLPAWLYDALEKSAETYGGIGAIDRFDKTGNPHCVIGHADVLDGISRYDAQQYYDAQTPALTGLRKAFGVVYGVDVAIANDRAIPMSVRAERIPFSDWCSRLNVVRGEEVTV